MQPAVGPMQQSFLSWMVAALGYPYAILLPGSALFGFVLTLIVVVRGKGPMAGAALVFIVPAPMLIGVFAAMEGGIRSFNMIATVAADPAPGQIARVISTLLAAPMVGMALTVPSYLLAAIGSLVRSFFADPESLKQGA
jgi:hypothetical protein